MRLDKQTDYSLRVLIYLGASPNRLVTIAEVAQRFAISRTHLMNVVHALGKAGFIVTVRGRAGGMRLAGDGSGIRVGDVVRRMEADLAPVECLRPSGGNCLISPCCRLKGVLAQAMKAFLSALDEWTIADLVRDNGALAVLLREAAA